MTGQGLGHPAYSLRYAWMAGSEAGHDERKNAMIELSFVMTGLDPVIQSLPEWPAMTLGNGSSRGAGSPF
jgi:hypothetical protein